MRLVDSLEAKDCCGCRACGDICPKHCITFVNDVEGFAYPGIDHKECINCGMCMRVCPSQNTRESNYLQYKCYAASCKQFAVRYNSSSGGVFGTLAALFLNGDGIVYGAAFWKDWTVRHTRIASIDELSKIQKSKYLQSDLTGVFKQIKCDLENGLKVLFAGTPCQVKALRDMPWASSKYNLICIDVACHAVPSAHAWHLYLSSIGIDSPEEIVNLDFRDKDYPWHNYTLSISCRSGKSVHEPCDKNPFMLGFIYNLYNRPSCSNCPAKPMQSGSDIMLADFWGIEKYAPEMDDDKGVSLVIVKTKEGEAVFDKIRDKIEFKSVSNDAFLTRKNTFLTNCTEHYLRLYFFRKANIFNFQDTVSKCLKHKTSFQQRVLRRIKNLFK